MTKKVEILGVRIDALSRSEAIKIAAGFLEEKKASLIFTPNPEIVVMAQKDRGLMEILNCRSSLNLPDGAGLLWAAKFNSLIVPAAPAAFKRAVIFLQWLFTLCLIPFYPKYLCSPLPERVSGVDFACDLARLSAKNRSRLFLLGGAPTVAERVALKLQTEILNLRIAGVHSGTPGETQNIIEAANRSKADVILVAFGAPKQEKWLSQNINSTACRIGMGVGGTFDFIAGVRKRAPLWMQKSGLEWLFRLATEPGRFRRQLAIPVFVWLVLKQKLKEKIKEAK